MAKPSSSLGIVVGILILALVAGGLATSPFYLGMLQGESGAIDAALLEDVPAITAAVNRLDPGLSAFAVLQEGIPEDQRLTDEEITLLIERYPDWQNEQLVEETQRIAQMIAQTARKDEARGTVIEGVQTRPITPNPQRAVQTFQSQYLSANERLRRKAEASISRLGLVIVGSTTAASKLEFLRARALLQYQTGRLGVGAAQHHIVVANRLRQAALKRLNAVARLQRTAADMEILKPRQVLDDVESQISDIDSELSQLQGMRDQLAETIAQMNSRIEQLRAIVAAAEENLKAIEQSDVAHSDPRYLQLGDEIREAEAEIALLRHGALVNASRVQPRPDDLLSANYEGGEIQAGLRHLDNRLALVNDQMSLREQRREALADRRSDLQDRLDGLEREREQVLAEADRIMGEVDAILLAADERVAKGLDAATKATEELDKAADTAGRALRAAQQRTQQARAVGGEPESVAQLVAGDKFTEAGIHLLRGEIAYTAAQARDDLARSARNRMQLESYTAGLVGAQPTDGPIHLNAQVRAGLEAVDTALKAFEQAQGLISTARVRGPEHDVSGSNIVWQVQVARASAQILLASLMLDQPAARAAGKDAAYALLKEAIEGREQSPFLSNAVDTFAHLQRFPN